MVNVILMIDFINDQKWNNNFYFDRLPWHFLIFFPIRRANPRGLCVREHWVEITKSGLELHSRERHCDVGQWPRGNTPGNQCLNTILVFNSCKMKGSSSEGLLDQDTFLVLSIISRLQIKNYTLNLCINHVSII